jgi:thioredoxin-like negative regulator of GroEL
MMLRSALFLCILPLLSSAAHASELSVEATWGRQGLTLDVIVPPGEHVAPEAPAGGWISLDGERFDMQLHGSTVAQGLRLPLSTQPSHALAGELSMGICTDDGSTCRQLTVAFAQELHGTRGHALLATPAHDGATAPSSAHDGDAEAAFARAKQSGKPVLLDFSTVWCPPCQTLAAEVLHDPADADLLDRFEVVELDADSPSSFAWKDQYGITGYPTVIIATPEGEIVGRMMGYDGEPEFLSWLDSMAGTATTVDDLLADLDAIPEGEVAGAARRLMDEGLDEEAALLVARVPDEADRALLQFKLAPTHDLLPILVEHKSDHIMEWVWTVVYELFQEDDTPDESRDLVRAAILKGIGEVSTEQAAELAYVLADLTPAEEHPEHIFALGAAIYRTAFTGDPTADRGRTSFLVDLLYRAGDVEGALAVVDEAIAHFPEEFTYHHKRAGVLHDEGRLEEALISGQAATAHATGDMSLRAAMKTAAILSDLDRTDDATRVLKLALTQAERPEEGLKVRTWRYIELIEAQLEELNP